MAAPALATLMGAQSNAEVAAFFNLCFRHRHTLDTVRCRSRAVSSTSSRLTVSCPLPEQVNSSKVESWFSCDDTAARKVRRLPPSSAVCCAHLCWFFSYWRLAVM